MENKVISNRFTARAFTLRFISSALLLCGMHPSGSLAQERVLMDLPLPPAAGVHESQRGARTPQAQTPGRATVPKAMAVATAPMQAPTPAATTASGPDKPDSASLPTAPKIQDKPREPLEAHRVLQVTLRKGESLYRVFRRHDLSQGDLLDMTKSSDAINRRLRRVRPGQKLSFDVTASGNVKRLVLMKSGPTDLVIEQQSARKYVMREIDDLPLVQNEKPAPAPATLAAKMIAGTPLESPQRPGPEQSQSGQSQTARAIPEQRQADTRTQKLQVKAGDSLYAIFKRAGLAPQELAALLHAGKPAARLRRLRPGQNLTLVVTPDNSLQSLTVELDETSTFTAVRKNADSFTARIDTHPLERRIATASAVIEDALFLADQRAGLSDRVIMQMVEIFGWDVDFALDVRAGDRFTIVYEELYKNGEKLRDGKILASEFHNRGRSIRALRYTNKEGQAAYFSPQGFSMRKAFLRTPVNFSRISSRFNRGRMHPVLQRMRAHKGVDYAAARGTPIKAAGHGRVEFSGRKGGYGKTVVLQHGGTYTTLYAHLSRIHSRARTGKRVKQGEIIGYVGKTGLATGPHLHYEFRVRGVHKDPLRVKLPKALPIEQRYKKDFLQKTRPLIAQLDALANTSIASSN